MKILTFHHHGPVAPVVIDHLYVPVVQVAVEDTVGPGHLLAVVEGQSNHVFEQSRVFEGL